MCKDLGLQALVVERQAKVGPEAAVELGRVARVADHRDPLCRCESGRRGGSGCPTTDRETPGLRIGVVPTRRGASRQTDRFGSVCATRVRIRANRPSGGIEPSNDAGHGSAGFVTSRAATTQTTGNDQGLPSVTGQEHGLEAAGTGSSNP